MSDLKEHTVQNIDRRSFFKTAASVTAGIMAGSSLTSVADIPFTGIQDKKKKIMWIDNHIHVSDIGPDGKKREKMLEDLIDVLDRCDADLRLIISNDGNYVSRMTSDPSAIMTGNRIIYDLCRRAPGRLFGSCTINANFPEESLAAMKTCFEEWGFVQFGEMLPYIHKYRLTDPSSEKLIRQAVRYNVPVQIHLGTWWCTNSKPGDSMDGMNQFADILEMMKRVPEAKYILAHAIGDSGPTPGCVSWSDMYLDTLKLFPEFPGNLWVEIANFSCPALKRTLKEIPSGRLISGTDWTTRIGPPFQPYGTMFGKKEKDNAFPAGVGSFLGFLKRAGATDEDIAKIAYGNSRELFRLSL